MLVVIFVYPKAARAWLFHEHTMIGRTAMASLPAADAEVLKLAWAELRADTPRLCPELWKPDNQFVLGPLRKPPEGDAAVCADFPMLPATAGDFSCAPDDLWDSVTRSEWWPKIARAAHRAEAEVDEASEEKDSRIRAEKVREAWRDNNVRNFEADQGFLQRARGNLAHFLWPRKSDDLAAYLDDAFSPGRAPNATAFYAVHHIAALRFARRAAEQKGGGSSARRTLLRWMFLSEATALHYLEDGFSAGHAVGRAGDSRDRTGTHDHYCEHGGEGRIWPAGTGLSGEADSYVAHGDAFMARVDQRHAAVAVRMSLRDVAQVLAGNPSARAVLTSDSFAPAEKVTEDVMDTCAERKPGKEALDVVPGWLREAVNDPWIWAVVRLSMMPALATGSEPEPRTTAPVFQTEAGMFVGAFAAGRISASTGFGGHGQRVRFPLLAEGGIEAGFGGTGVTTSRSDAMLHVSLGAVLQSAELDAPFAGEPVAPARIGFSVRLRSPFRYVPAVELLYTIPGTILGSSNARNWFISAAEDGFFGIERAFRTPAGTFQIVLLREVCFRYLTLAGGTGASGSLEFPVLEMKPHPWYAGSIANAFVIQLGTAIDFGPLTGSIGGYLRVGLDARRYLSLAL